MAELSANVRMIKGIGEQRAKALGKLGIVTLRDLIGWFPRRYEDRRSVKRIMDLIPGESACVAAMIASPPQLSHVRRGMDLVKVRAVDDTGMLEVTVLQSDLAEKPASTGGDLSLLWQGRGQPPPQNHGQSCCGTGGSV